MERSLKRKKSIAIVIFTYLLFIFGGVCLKSDRVNAAEETVSISLYSGNPEENIPFQLTNMFPGDSVTQDYKLSVSYTGTIKVNFHATVRNGGEKLSEVLEIKVRQADTGEMLYEGMMADMPVLGQELSTDSKSLTEELTYRITVGVSTSVGNEYQNKKLIADLSWWAEGEESTKPSEPESSEDSTEPSEPESSEDPTEPSESESEESEEDASSTGGSLTDPNPLTGDDSQIFLWLASLCVSMAVMILVFIGYRRSRLVMDVSVSGMGCKGGGVTVSEEAGGKKNRRRLFLGIFLTVLLVLMLGITSLALIYQKVTVEENLFQTGTVSIISLNEEPVFDLEKVEPGMVLKEDFILRNDSTCDVHYRLYFTNVDGELADMIQVEVFDTDITIHEGILTDMNGQKSEGADGILREGEERAIAIVLKVPEYCGNLVQGQALMFDLNADAVQMVNNPDGLFE